MGFLGRDRKKGEKIHDDLVAIHGSKCIHLTRLPARFISLMLVE